MYARVLALAGLVAITPTAFAPAALPMRAPVRSYPLLTCRVITQHSLVAKPANLQYRYVCMTSNILSHITQVEASETLVRELEAGQHCLKKTENADNKKTKKHGMNEQTSSLLATDRDQRQAFRRQDRDRRLALHWSVLLLRSVPSNLAYSCRTPFGP